MSESANGASAPARSTASRSAGGYACSAVARMRTFGREPGSTSMAARLMPSPEVPDIIPTAITGRFSCERRRHGFVHRDAEAVHRVVVAAPEVHAVREQDDGEVEPRIDPERRARESCVAVGVDAEVAADHRAVGRAEGEAEPAPHVLLLHTLGPRLGREVVPDDGAVAEDPRDRRDVRGRPEEASVPGRASEGVRVLVVDLAAEAAHPPLRVFLRRDAALREPRTEVRIHSLDGQEDPFAHEIGERGTADRGEPLREHDVAEVAVRERAEVLRERLLCRAPNGLLTRLRLLPERQPPLQTGGVRQHMRERDVVLSTAVEIGDELAERRVEREDLVLDERQHESGGRELRQRREVEERIDRARRVGSGARIGAERSNRELADLTATLDAHDARGAERADRRLGDGARRRGKVAQLKSRMPAPIGKRSLTTTGSEPTGLRAPVRTSTTAWSVGTRPSYAHRHAATLGAKRTSYGPRRETSTVGFAAA